MTAKARHPFPSPLAGEGGGGRSPAPGEGEATGTTLAEKSRSLRHNMTDAEQVLWRLLRNHRFSGAKFRRQVPVGPFIADFLSYSARLIIEADGGQHCENKQDAARDAWFHEQRFRVLRFWNNDILENLEGVAATIASALVASPSPGRSAATLSRKGRGVSSNGSTV